MDNCWSSTINQISWFKSRSWNIFSCVKYWKLIAKVLGNRRNQFHNTVQWKWRLWDTFQGKFYRNNHGQFVICLPRKKGLLLLGNCLANTEPRFHVLEKILKKNKILQRILRISRTKYLIKAWAHLIPSELNSNINNERPYYLSHYAVHKKTTLNDKNKSSVWCISYDQ